MVLVGYNDESTNYRLFDPVTKKIKISRDVLFNEVPSKYKFAEDSSTISIDLSNNTVQETDDPSTQKEPQQQCTENRQIEQDQADEPKQSVEKRYGLRSRDNLHPPDRYESESKESDGRDIPYREAIGCLMFAAIVSRPDIAFAVSYLSRFANNHNDSH